MRYSYFQLARKYQLGFLVFHLDLDLNSAVERNSKRSPNETITIPIETIQRMHEEFQKPEPSFHFWEQNSIVFDARENFCLNLAMESVEKSFTQPVQPMPEVNQDEIEKSRKANLENKIHKSDQLLRILIGEIINETEPSQRKQVASKLAESKKEILEKIRNDEFPDIDVLNADTRLRLKNLLLQ